MNRSLAALPRLLLPIMAGLTLAFVALPTLADPPTRAARISLTSSNASFSPAGSDEWLQARVNRPIWIGDRLWSGDGRVELQIGGASLRLAPGTSLQVLNFDDRIAQFEVTRGSVALHVRSIDKAETIEIDTPSFAFVTHEAGDYRIDVEPDLTAVSARRGFADVYGQAIAYRIDRRERFAFYTADLRDYDAGPLPPPDAFDRWARERAQREDRSTSSRYVSPELVGFVDLDSYGDWRNDTTHGNVWVPRVAADWAPYRYGNWTWVDPWGWTWVDDAPWGYAPSHYGRWTQLGRSWAWVPGPRNVRPVYSPALVAWVGGGDFSLTVASGRARGVGWFPLAPGEVWRPSYDVSRDYFTRANVANTVVNNTTVVNIYNNRNDARISNVDYRFRSAPAAVTAVPVDTFVQGRPVQLTQAQMSANAAAQANVLRSAPAQPVIQSLVGAAPRAQARPPAETLQRQVVARTAPAPVQPIEQRAAQVREGQPVTRESLDRAAPPAQPVAPQRPSTVSPGSAQSPSAQTPPAQAPAATVAPGQLRSNVRVVETDKGTPKPLPPAPEGGSRAARNEAEKGRPTAPVAAQPAPGQAAQPSQAPQPAQPGQPGRVAAPPAGIAQPTQAPVAPPTPGPQPAPPPQPAQVAPTSPPAAAKPAQQERAERLNGPDRGGRGEAARPGAPGPTAAPVPAPQPAAAPPSPARPVTPPGQPPQPATPAPGADPPNVEQLRGRGAPGRDRPVASPDERRALPAQQTQPAPPSAAPPASPRAAEAPPAIRDVRPAPAAVAPAPQPPRQGTEARRPAPVPVPAAAAPPARAAEAPQRPTAPPSAQPAQAPAASKPAPERRRQEQDSERERGKDKEKDKEDKK